LAQKLSDYTGDTPLSKYKHTSTYPYSVDRPYFQMTKKENRERKYTLLVQPSINKLAAHPCSMPHQKQIQKQRINFASVTF
jgi:hypothetical protein